MGIKNRMATYPIPHAIRPSASSRFHNTETLLSRPTDSDAVGLALTGEPLCYSSRPPTDELHGGLDSGITLPQHPSRGAGPARHAGEGVGPSPTYVNDKHLKHKEV